MGQRGINHVSVPKPMKQLCCSAATRAQSLGCRLRKPQIESVKKNLVIVRCESILESFVKGLAIMLRWVAALRLAQPSSR